MPLPLKNAPHGSLWVLVERFPGLSLSLSYSHNTHTHSMYNALSQTIHVYCALSLSLHLSMCTATYSFIITCVYCFSWTQILSLSLSMSTAIFIIPHVMGCTYKLLDAFFVVTYIGLWKNCKVNPKSKSFHCSLWKYPRVWCSNPLQLRLVSKLFWLTLNEKFLMFNRNEISCSLPWRNKKTQFSSFSVTPAGGYKAVAYRS